MQAGQAEIHRAAPEETRHSEESKAQAAGLHALLARHLQAALDTEATHPILLLNLVVLETLPQRFRRKAMTEVVHLPEPGQIQTYLAAVVALEP